LIASRQGRTKGLGRANMGFAGLGRRVSGGSARSASVALRLVATALVVAALAGCGSSGPGYEPAPPGYYRIRAGDTLLKIAGRYKVGYRALASWNGLEPPYMIYAGSLLRVEPPDGKGNRVAGVPPVETRPTSSARTAEKRTAGRTSDQYASTNATGKATSGKSSARATAGAGPANTGGKTSGTLKARIEGYEGNTPKATSTLRWQWPIEGKVVQTFRAGDRTRHGIRIAARPEQKVVAAAPGTVVYSGSGLKGYGNLIILKHIDGYLSAYGFNRRLLVAEGARVESGQVVAELGQTAGGENLLHFEIRRNGVAVDPLQYLP